MSQTSSNFFKTPKVYLLGYTTVDKNELIRYLEDSDQKDFLKEVETALEEGLDLGEILCSFYAKACYASLTNKKNKNITKTRAIADNIVGILGSGHGSVIEHCSLNFMITDCSRVFTHELVRHRAGTAFCLDGDTEVWSAAKVHGRFEGVKKKWKIRDLYNWQTDKKRKGRLKLILVRCFNGQEFVQAPIGNLFKSESKPSFKVTLDSGREIICSKEHRFLTQDGWSNLASIKIGDMLGSNGRQGVAASWEKETIRRGKISSKMKGADNHRWLGDGASKNAGRLRAIKMYPTQPCIKCHKPNGHRHHKDRNTHNNEQGNIEFLCNSCHGKLHVEEDGPKNKLTVKWEKVVSISPAGNREMYDLEVIHDAHNFVANGFVTHNSQTSGRYVRNDVLNVVIDPILEPAHDLVEEARSYIEGWYKKMEERLAIDSIRDFGRKKKLTSAMRRMLPNGQTNEMGMSINIRALRHTIESRTSHHAEWEIRVIFGQIYQIVKKKYKVMFADANEEMIDGLLEVTFKNKKV